MKKSLYLSIFFTLLFPIFAEGDNCPLLDDSNFYDVTGNEIFIVDFYADWCGSCSDFAPVFEEVAQDMPQYNFAKVDVMESMRLCEDFGARKIPYIVAIQQGEIIELYEGDKSAVDFSAWVEQIYSN